MNKIEDPMPVLPAERPNYAEGVMLAAEDFRSEQNYHRGRLARALALTAGYGTVAGLEVVYQAPGEDSPARLRVAPGLAIDRLGRLVELERAHCLELGPWYAGQEDDVLARAWHEAGALWEGAPAGVVADLYLRFELCGVGKTPAFDSSAAGSFNSVVDARLRDGAALELVPFKQGDPSPLPPSEADLEQDPVRLREAIFAAWEADRRLRDLEPVARERAAGLLLARVLIPADAEMAEGPPVRRFDAAVVVRNDLRPFVVSAMLLRRWLDIGV